MTDDDSNVFLGNDQTARTNGWPTASINVRSVPIHNPHNTTYVQRYQHSYGYTFTQTNLYETEAFNKQTKKKTPPLKKKVLSNPLLTLTERTKLDEPRE